MFYVGIVLHILYCFIIILCCILLYCIYILYFTQGDLEKESLLSMALPSLNKGLNEFKKKKMNDDLRWPYFI